MPMTPFIGVRISWLMLARNSLLAALASSARVVISVDRLTAASRRRFVSASSAAARLRAVMSLEMPNVPTTLPSLPVRGSLVVDAHASRPLGPGLPFLVVDQGQPGTHDLLFVLECRSRLGWREVVDIRLADGFRGIVQPERPGHRPADPREAAVDILEVDVVRRVVHEGLEQGPCTDQLTLRTLALGRVAHDADGMPFAIDLDGRE